MTKGDLHRTQPSVSHPDVKGYLGYLYQTPTGHDKASVYDELGPENRIVMLAEVAGL